MLKSDLGAWVIFEPIYVNDKSKFTEKSCEPGSQKYGSRSIFKFFYSNNREPNFRKQDFSLMKLYFLVHIFP